MLGLPPTWMLEMGKQSGEFFEKTQDEFGRKTYRLKSLEQYSREHNKKEEPSKKYFQASTLEEIIRSYPMPRKNMKQAEIERGMVRCKPFCMHKTNQRRIEQPSGLYRLRPWFINNQPIRAMVTAAGQAAPFHHTAEVHRTLRTTDELEVCLAQQDRSTWNSAATTSRELK